MTTAPSQMTQQVTQQLVDLLAPPASVAKLTQASRLLAKWRTILLENTLVQKDGENVQSGPFKGMVYAWCYSHRRQPVTPSHWIL